MNLNIHKEIKSSLPFRCRRGRRGRAFHTTSAPSPHFLAWCLSERCCDFGNCAHSCLEDKGWETSSPLTLLEQSSWLHSLCFSPLHLRRVDQRKKNQKNRRAEICRTNKHDSLVTATWRFTLPSSITSITSSGLVTNRSVQPLLKTKHIHSFIPRKTNKHLYLNTHNTLH